VSSRLKQHIQRSYNKLTHRRGTARRSRAVSVEILSIAAQMYEKLHSKRLKIGEWR